MLPVTLPPIPTARTPLTVTDAAADCGGDLLRAYTDTPRPARPAIAPSTLATWSAVSRSRATANASNPPATKAPTTAPAQASTLCCCVIPTIIGYDTVTSH